MMKLFILVYNCVALLEAESYPQRFSFPNETVVPMIISSSSERLGGFPMAMHIRISRYDLYLTLIELLLPASFTSTHYDGNDRKLITAGFMNCYYQGLVGPFQHKNMSFQNWNVSLSTCKGLQGEFGSNKDGFIYIKPTGIHFIEQEHLLYQILQDPLQNVSDYYCKAIKKTIHFSQTGEVPGGTNSLGSAFYIIEIEVYNDLTQYIQQGSNIEALVTRSISIINRVDMLFFPLDINVVLVGVVTWSNRDLIVFPGDNNINDVLDNFNFYLRREDMISDVTLLLSGRSFAQNALGAAFITGACARGYSGIIVGQGRRLVEALAVTTAHEIGHTLGMDHDDMIVDTVCSCGDKTGYCIMASTLYSNIDFYSQWSSCSRNSFLHFAPSFTCLLNTPSSSVMPNPVCGNGVVEAGEECDCNGGENCAAFSSCCNTTTCQFLESSTPCRPKGDDDCDLPDYCNEQTGSCLNHHLEDGQTCWNANNEQSYCIGSVCIVRDAQCKQFYGPNSVNAVDECYLQNSLGNIQGHCGIEFLYPMFRPCSGINYKCGLLHCEGGSFIGSVAEPVHHNSVQVEDGDGITHTCLSFTTLLNSSLRNQPTFVHHGTPCGISMACLNYLSFPACGFSLDLEPRYSQCPTNDKDVKCSGTNSGRCSNFNLCVCNAGYYGASCNNTDECLMGAHNCQQICTDIDANFTCICNPGHTLASNGANCTDINECLVGNGGCAQICINTVGSFKCSCYNGYELVNNSQCRKKYVDECLVNNGGCAHICSNTLDSFICSCDTGYQLSENGLSCEDINECFMSTHNCQEICINTVGSFKCYCKLGYDIHSDGATCIGCVQSGRCAHSCYMGMCLCFDGFTLDSNNKTCSGTNTGGSSMVYTAMLALLTYVLVWIL